MLKGKGNIVVLMGELSNEAARTRTKDIEDVIATPECSSIKILDKREGKWSRTSAQDIVTNWLSAGTKFDDNFLTVLRNGMKTHAATLKGVDLQFEDAQNDVGKQLNQMQNFIAQKVDAIIVNPVDTDATPKMTQLATAAGIPLVYVNRKPADFEKLPAGVAFVASDE